jgi:DnaK suppressor protein
MLTKRKKAELRRTLQRSREAVFTNVAGAEVDLRFVAEDRESEIEERAQEESAAHLLARLDDRGKEEIRAIDRALHRLAEGTYGICVRCKKPIPVARLEAAPTAPHCAHCARQFERASDRSHPSGGPPSRPRPQLPADLCLLSDSELAEALRELVREHGRIDVEELRITCRHGIIHLTGTLPSEAERQIVHKLLTDVEGLEEIVDRVRVSEMPWERSDRAVRVEPLPDEVSRELFEVTRTDDVGRAAEDGIPYEPPDEPPPDEE